MIRLITILMAVAAIIYMVRWYREQTRINEVQKMTTDELVEAVIRRKISILEVPSEHREAVNEMLQEIQSELDKT
ncbi:MAG: hypothetical protein V2I97_21510 [Desulfococcaceae bacterium]|jgi:hypothetical protein|nr:hypothetical protein [Desulfococcaceae bacterium]